MTDVVLPGDGPRALAAWWDNATAFDGLVGAVPGAAYHRGTEVSWVDSGVAQAAFNSVRPALATAAGWSTALAQAAPHFAARRLPYHCTVELGPDAMTIGPVLYDWGLVHDETEPAMWADLTVAAPDAPPVPGLTTHPVQDSAALWDWMTVWGCGAPSAVVESWYQLYSQLPYASWDSLRMYLGRLSGEPAATVYVFLGAGVAAVHYVVTRPEYRRRGIGAAMTRLARDEARAAGYRVAVLTASDLGLNMYRRLGFTECGRLASYVWHPREGATP